MKTLALIATLIALPAFAADYRPAACSNAAEFFPAYDCPAPYVELEPPAGGDDVFSRVWQCSATTAAIGMVKREHGNEHDKCASAGFTRWTLPTDPDFALRSAVRHTVIMPCLRDAIADAPASARGLMTVDAAAEYAYLETKNVLAPFAENAVRHAKSMDASVHAEFFAFAKDACYEAVAGAF